MVAIDVPIQQPYARKPLACTSQQSAAKANAQRQANWPAKFFPSSAAAMALAPLLEGSQLGLTIHPTLVQNLPYSPKYSDKSIQGPSLYTLPVANLAEDEG